MNFHAPYRIPDFLTPNANRSKFPVSDMEIGHCLVSVRNTKSPIIFKFDM